MVQHSGAARGGAVTVTAVAAAVAAVAVDEDSPCH